MALPIPRGKGVFSVMAALRRDTVDDLAPHGEDTVPCASRAATLALSLPLSLDTIAEDTHSDLIRMRIRSRNFFAIYRSRPYTRPR